MEIKDFQERTLDTLDEYLTELFKQRAASQAGSEFIRQHPELGIESPDFPKLAWNNLKNSGKLPQSRRSRQFVSRVDGTGEPFPAVCLKIPTGGGKTFLAAHAVSRISGTYLESNHGFVLWIVPNDAIYTQTKKQLNNREGSIRQILDRAAAGRVKILEKDDPLNALDVESNLCVMLLMLQSANRNAKETLRLFRDRGNVHGFFPAEDDVQKHFDLLGRIPNLDCYGRADTMGATVKDSLGNVMRLLRPLVVMDEGHKAYTTNALKTINGFNPSFVLELSATPKDDANWLVDVRGRALQDAEMVKLPVNVKVKAGDDWKDCLRESYDKLNSLQTTADVVRAECSRYIRPILVVQAERTGKDQRDNNMIHAEDVREFLQTVGLDKSQIAVKTADTNELDDTGNEDLLSSTCPIRVIVTKQALQEGWDCPFAYVLCTLATNRNENALTQLIGRILRQPETKYLPEKYSDLNESYVFCHHAQTKQVVERIKEGLEKDGLGDLAAEVRAVGGEDSAKPVRRKVQRREKFRNLSVYLPLVNWVDGDKSRALDYDSDVLYRIDWSLFNLQPLVELLTNPADVRTSYVMKIGVGGEGKDWLVKSASVRVVEETHFDTVYATRLLTDILPNPWVARAVIEQLLQSLQARGLKRSTIAGMSGYIIEEMRKEAIKERDRLAETQFREDVAAERIQFRLRADRNPWKMPMQMDTDLPEASRQLAGRSDGEPIKNSVFAPVYDAEFNSDEAEFACYLDESRTLEWWHRNVAKPGQYALQGWKKSRVYPDFLFALQGSGKKKRILVWETKGDHLAGDPGTDYKRDLMRLMSANFRSESVVKAGELELVNDDGTTVACEMVLMTEWKSRIHTVLQDN